MRTRSVITTMTTAVLLSATVVTPAHAFVDVVTRTTPSASPSGQQQRSCTLISDEYLSPSFSGVLGIVSVFADAGATIDNLPFIDEVLDFSKNSSKDAEVSPQLKQQLTEHNLTVEDIPALIEAIRAHRVMSGQYGPKGEIKDNGLDFIFSIFFRQTLVPGQEKPSPGFSYAYASINSEEALKQAQAHYSAIDFSSFERYLVTLESGSGGKKTDARYEKASPGLRALYEASYERQKPTIRQLITDFTTMSYSDYQAIQHQRQMLVKKASTSCGKWIDGSIGEQDVLNYAGPSTDYTFSGFTLDALRHTPSDKDPENPGTHQGTNSSSVSTSGIVAVILALMAAMGGVGAWLAGLIPGLPRPQLPQ